MPKKQRYKSPDQSTIIFWAIRQKQKNKNTYIFIVSRITQNHYRRVWVMIVSILVHQVQSFTDKAQTLRYTPAFKDISSHLTHTITVP
jgi:hypothetical protein